MNYLFSQSGWFWQNPLPSSNPIAKVKFVDSNFGMGVGDFGTVIKTTNGGSLWFNQYNFTAYNLKNLYMLDSSKIFVIGEGGSLFLTSNGGTNWNKIDVSTNSQFNDITFLNLNTGFIAGQGKVLRTSNGGQNWSYYSVNTEINSICFVNSDTGFLSGYYNQIYKTINSGNNWTLINPEIYGNWYSIYFKDANNGLLFGNKVLRTTNGGLNWILSYSNGNQFLYSHYAIDSSILFSGGGNGLLLKTTDFGISWSTIPSGLPDLTISSIKFFNDSSITILGWGYPGKYDIVTSSNAGSTWSSQLQGMRGILSSVDFIDVNTGLVTGSSGNVLRTTNGGQNWIETPTGSNYQLDGLELFKNGTGYASSLIDIYKTIDYGLTWTQIVLIPGEYGKVSFINPNTGLVIGTYVKGLNYYPRVLKTTDGGNSWTNLVSGISESNLRNVQMIDEFNWFVIGYGIFKTTNAGQNWNRVHVTSDYKRAIYFHNHSTGFVAGVNKIFHTTNGGQNWTSFDHAKGGSINSINFLNESTGWTVGYNLYNTHILKTQNGGLNWAEFRGITANVLNDISIIDENILVAVGSGGTILKSTNGGISVVSINNSETVVPNNFYLFQNYPNPFNSQTKIKFMIPKSSFIKLIVHDAIGREVDKLVNEYKYAGEYEIDWYANHFPSGIYFFRMESADFIETKKMALVK